MNAQQTVILRGSIQRMKTDGKSDKRIQDTIQGLVKTINPPPITLDEVNALLVAQGVASIDALE